MKLGIRTKSISGVAFLLLAGTAIVGVQSTKVPPETISVISTATEIQNDPVLSIEKNKVNYGFANSSGVWQSSKTDAGKIVVLYFWSTWCQPCESMTTWMEDIWRHYKETGLVLTAIALDTEIETVQRTVRARKNEIPYAFIPKEVITESELINGAPLVLVLSKKGDVLKRFEGLVTEAELRNELDRLILKK